MKSTEDKIPTTIDEVYLALNAIYSCRYADNREERLEAIAYLTTVCNKEGVSYQTLYKKMRELKKATGDEFQSKLASQIMNRFWEKEYFKRVPRHQFNKE